MKTRIFSNITVRILSAAILPALFMCVVLTVYSLNVRTKESRLFLQTRGEQLSSELASMSEFALISGDGSYLSETIKMLLQDPEIYSIEILDKAGNPFITKVRESRDGYPDQNLMIKFESPVYRILDDINTFDLGQEIDLDILTERQLSERQLIGYVVVHASPHIMREKQAKIIVSGTLLAIAALLIATLIGLMFSRSILRPIKRIISAVKDIRSGNYETRIRSENKDELGLLSNNIDGLASELGSYRDEISRKMVELTAARENADRANATKSMFLARVSHELRDPLTAVVGNLEILLNTQTSEYQERAIRLSEKNTEFLLRQIDDILEFSLLEAGHYHIDYQYFNIADAIEIVNNIAKPKADAKGLIFSISLNTDNELTNCQVESDPIRLQQILINLVGNAIKFTHQGGVYTSINLRQSQSNPGRAQISIEVLDTGVGIEKENISRIFQMFEQVQSPISREYGGVGLGLTIAKCIVEAMGGEISVESQPQEGSKFTVSLEANYSSAQKELKNGNISDKYNETGKVEKILLVEDNPDNQQVISALLHNIGIDVDIANNGIEGLEKLKESHYNIIFVDCFMPQMDGFEFTRRVREHETSTEAKSKTLLIGITAGAHKENIEKCYAAGMDDVITKPFYRIDIYKRVLGFKKAQDLLKKMARISGD